MQSLCANCADPVCFSSSVSASSILACFHVLCARCCPKLEEEATVLCPVCRDTVTCHTINSRSDLPSDARIIYGDKQQLSSAAECGLVTKKELIALIKFKDELALALLSQLKHGIQQQVSYGPTEALWQSEQPLAQRQAPQQEFSPAQGLILPQPQFVSVNLPTAEHFQALPASASAQQSSLPSNFDSRRPLKDLTRSSVKESLKKYMFTGKKEKPSQVSETGGKKLSPVVVNSPSYQQQQVVIPPPPSPYIKPRFKLDQRVARASSGPLGSIAGPTKSTQKKIDVMMEASTMGMDRVPTVPKPVAASAPSKTGSASHYLDIIAKRIGGPTTSSMASSEPPLVSDYTESESPSKRRKVAEAPSQQGQTPTSSNSNKAFSEWIDQEE